MKNKNMWVILAFGLVAIVLYWWFKGRNTGSNGGGNAGLLGWFDGAVGGFLDQGRLMADYQGQIHNYLDNEMIAALDSMGLNPGDLYLVRVETPLNDNFSIVTMADVSVNELGELDVGDYYDYMHYHGRELFPL